MNSHESTPANLYDYVKRIENYNNREAERNATALEGSQDKESRFKHWAKKGTAIVLSGALAVGGLVELSKPELNHEKAVDKTYQTLYQDIQRNEFKHHVAEKPVETTKLIIPNQNS